MATIPRWNRHVNIQLLDDPELGDVLSPGAIERHCRQLGYRWRDSFWSPTTTVVTFLLQVLDGAKTLRSAVGLLLTRLAVQDQTDLPSCDPTAYCQARRRLPADVLTRLVSDVSHRMASLATDTHAWLGHRVWVIDGSSVGMPDTPSLQAAFPQPTGQRPGCGFPVAQIVAVFCWTTGALVDLIVDALRPHELTLVRRLYDLFEQGDVLLADRAYAAYVDMVRLLQQGVFCVFRLHQRRKADLRAGKRLGPQDRLVTWSRPQQWIESCGLSRDAFERLPETLTVRLVRVTEAPRGFRSRTLTLVATLLDPIQTPADAIRALYRDRWTIELNLRSLKIALGMDVLRGKSPDVVYKEIAMHMLAYNLIRLVMWRAARRHGRAVHRLSFAGTLHRIRAAVLWLLLPRHRANPSPLLTHLYACVAADTLPHRPDRFEPRRVKRRPKQYSRLINPRQWYHHHGDSTCR